MAEIDVTGLPLDDARLAEIRNLLRYESSITFHSHRAVESMWLLVAEVERLRGREAVTLALHSRQEDEHGRPVCFECWPKVTSVRDAGQIYVPWPCPTAQAVLPPADVREATL